uniref:Uncharacterized protein n=1 Tax=Bracon brevicornis TaxID=1563983 RepID=A0A6V7HVZ7_9HYME
MLSMTQNTTRTSQHENTHLELPDDESSVASDSEDPPRKRPKREVSPSD